MPKKSETTAANLDFENRAKDIVGRVYEYFLTMFASPGFSTSAWFSPENLQH